MRSGQQLPKDWIRVSLAQVTEVIDPHPSHRAPDEEEAGVPFAGIGDLNEQGELVTDSVRRVSSSVLNEHASRYTLSGSSIGFGRVASIGKVIDFPESISGVAISPTMAVIEPKSIDPKYLVHSLRSDFVREQIDRLLTGTTRSSLGIELLRGLCIPMPPNGEPEKIGSLLTTVDNAIRQTEALIAKYQQIKAGLMHDLFTRGVTPDGQLRPTYGQAPYLYKESSLGWIPKEWEVVAIGNLAESVVDGPFGSNLKTEHYVAEPGVRVVRLQNVQDGQYNDLDRAFIAEDHANYLARNQVNPGDVLIAGLGEDNNVVGRACCYPERLPSAINKADCFRLRCTSLLAFNRFVMYFLNTATARYQVRRFEQGVTRRRINTCNLKRVYVALPSKDEQTRIVSVLDNAVRKIETTTEYQAKLRQQKQGLMQDLLTGRVRVKVTDLVSR